MNYLIASTIHNTNDKLSHKSVFCSNLANDLQQKNINCSVVLPYYKSTKNIINAAYVGYTYAYLNNKSQYIGLFKKHINNIVYYFIDNEEYFYNDDIYSNYKDGEILLFYNIAVCEILKLIEKIDIIHCNDYESALIPFFLKYKYDNNIKTVLTIHDINKQGIYNKDICNIFEPFNEVLLLDDTVNFLKTGITTSTIITTTSNNYKKEILNTINNTSLNIFLNKNNLHGILNEIETNIYKPNKNELIYQPYSNLNVYRKIINKEIFCKNNDLNTSNMLISYTNDLTFNNGIDILIDNFDFIIKYTNINLCIIGTGSDHYKDTIRCYSYKFPNRIKFVNENNTNLSKQIYSISDVILLPYRYKPYSAEYMIAQSYGTICLTSEIGSSLDIVEPYNKYLKTGNGFSYKNPKHFNDILLSILEVYSNNKDMWNILIKNSINKTFTFSNTSLSYLQLIHNIKNK